MYEMYQITYFIPFMNKQIFDYFFEKLDVIVFLLSGQLNSIVNEIFCKIIEISTN